MITTLIGGGLLSLIVGAGGFASTIMALPLVAGVAAFFSSKLGRVLALIAGIFLFGAIMHHRGAADEAGKCQAAALASQLAAQQIDLNTQTRRAGEALLVLKGLREADAANRIEIDRLEKELKSRPLQSTKPGAKVDAQAILDDQCLYTPYGARRSGGGLRGK